MRRPEAHLSIPDSGTVHNAKKCTFDGRDHWLGTIMRGRHVVDVEGFNTKQEAIDWVTAQFKARGLTVPEIKDTTSF